MKRILMAIILGMFSTFILAKNITNIPTKGTVALTFDDGPNPTFTPQILQILHEHHIKATFFVVGANAQKYPDLIKRIHDEGHIIASHSQTHPLLTKLNLARLRYEIQRPSIIIYKTLGIKPLCLRYPFGASNALVRQTIAENGMLPTSMGFNSFDYNRPGTDKIVSWVLQNVHAHQVLLFHDGYDKREQTVAALPRIIAGIQKKGLGFSVICG